MHFLFTDRSALLEERLACGLRSACAGTTYISTCTVVSPWALCCSLVAEGCRPLLWGLWRRLRQVGRPAVLLHAQAN